MAVVLDFEKPIAELEKKLQDLREFSDKQGVDVGQSIEILEEKIASERKNVYSRMTPWQRVQLARHPERPYARDYIARLFTDFLELHGDRRYADDGAMIGGFAKFKDHPVMVIGTQKGRNLEENVAVNFGSAHPEGYRKALRFMEMADKACVPIVVLVDTPGAYPGIAAEERHIAEAIAVNLREMFTFTVPIVVAVIGEGGSGGALGIGIGNRVLVMENAYYSVITPEGCAAILWRDGAAAPKAAEALKLTGPDLMKFGLIDEIVKEPLGGANRDWDTAAGLLAEAIDRNLCELRRLTPDELRADRYDKFRLMGVFEEGK